MLQGMVLFISEIPKTKNPNLVSSVLDILLSAFLTSLLPWKLNLNLHAIVNDTIYLRDTENYGFQLLSHHFEHFTFTLFHILMLAGELGFT